mmetsp:Transcript_69846/g.152374  ORF Transcript_69846/g.152374 Transcript_69846/m.152374 type:complete len:243 (-) Transcript_69846:910-1638(-)
MRSRSRRPASPSRYETEAWIFTATSWLTETFGVMPGSGSLAFGLLSCGECRTTSTCWRNKKQLLSDRRIPCETSRLLSPRSFRGSAASPRLEASNTRPANDVGNKKGFGPRKWNRPSSTSASTSGVRGTSALLFRGQPGGTEKRPFQSTALRRRRRGRRSSPSSKTLTTRPPRAARRRWSDAWGPWRMPKRLWTMQTLSSRNCATRSSNSRPPTAPGSPSRGRPQQPEAGPCVCTRRKPREC